MKNIQVPGLLAALILVSLVLSDVDFNKEDYYIEDPDSLEHSSNLTVFNEKTVGDSADELTTINQDFNDMAVQFDFDSLMKCIFFLNKFIS